MNSPTPSLPSLHQQMLACRKCLEAGHTITPGAIFRGGPGARVMLIGQAPGVTEVTAKRPFNAGSGRRLFQWLGEAGWDEADFRARHYMTAVTKCYPGPNKSGRGDRVPSKAEQALCRPWLDQEIRSVSPVLMILVGGLAIKLLYPPSARLDEIVGTAAFFPPGALRAADFFDLSQAQRVNSLGGDGSNEGTGGNSEGGQEGGRWIVPLPHPSGASLWPNKPENQALIQQAIGLLRDIRERYAL